MHTDDVVTIAKCGRAACTHVAIIDDASLENMEEFVITVETNSSLNPLVIFEDSQAVVTIADNDGIYIHTYNDCIIVDSIYMCHTYMYVHGQYVSFKLLRHQLQAEIEHYMLNVSINTYTLSLKRV